MNQRSLLTIFVTMMSLFLFGFSESSEKRDTFLVHGEELKSSQSHLLKTLEKQKIDMVYLTTDPTKKEEYYGDFIRKAHEQGIEVHATAGDPSWGLTKNQDQLLAFTDWVKEFNASVDEPTQFDGIHLKIQPFYLPEWYDDRDTVIAEWKQNVTAFKEAVADLDVEVSNSIPFWFDDIKTPGQEETPFYEWLMAQFDHTTILAYRDTLEGENGIVSLIEDEMDAAERLNTEIIVGVTLENTGQDHVTFFEEGIVDMNMHLALVDIYVGRWDSYVGTSIDSYTYWRQSSQDGEEDVEDEEESEEQPFIRGTYVWHPELVRTEPDQIIQFAKEQGLNHLYTQMDVSQPYDVYTYFVSEATKAGIEVHAMGGGPKWALKEKKYRITRLTDYVKNYNEQAAADEKFAGVHLDIEPYVLPEWDEDKEAVLRSWMTNLEHFVQEVEEANNLESSVDLAMWFDDEPTPGNPDTPFNEWVINQVDHTSIMAFRDFAEGHGGIIDMAQNEIDHADNLGKEITISVEMKQNETSDHITFFDEGKAEMESQLAIVNDYFKEFESYEGYSVHAYKYWTTANN
ncbi:hypothetical protein [Pontibacillus halophilus]|nr:hypothetical protein [Pontibacillus halophilus]